MTNGNEYSKCFAEYLKRAYIADPCKVLPNAFWKTRDRLPGLRCTYRHPGDAGEAGKAGNERSGGGASSESGAVAELQGWSQDELELHVLWNESRQYDPSLRQKLEQAGFLIIHGDYMASDDASISDTSRDEVARLNRRQYRLAWPYFRLKHDHQYIAPYALPEGFWIKDSSVVADSVADSVEFAEISDFIGRCYRDMHPSPEAVESWTKYPVFESNLWIWIMDHNVPAALGIAEFDGSVPEGSLEWIQVLPEYQGRGLGKALVLELLNRLKERAAFTTVSGEVDNVTNPERLYRSCGFEGDDVWWLLRK